MDKTAQLKKLIKRELKKIKDECGEINLFISGGVDSSVLAALGNPDRLFTVKLPYGSKYDEFSYTKKVVKHLGLEDKLTVVKLDESEFKDVMKLAVKAIGRPIPHFNIFPFFVACREAAKQGVKHIVTGDGPDESMCGYTRHLIMKYIYKVEGIEAFHDYFPTIGKILTHPVIAYTTIINKPSDKVISIMKDKTLLDGMCAVDMALMRPDMDDMTNGIAKYFGITIHRPYQDNSEIDNFMFNLKEKDKIYKDEWGKYLLRRVADKLLPKEIAWKKHKVGGPLVPVNKIMGWEVPEFSKNKYMEYQEEILNA
jgi:asparagine synthetase B (glutamine-hydrolysing)